MKVVFLVIVAFVGTFLNYLLGEWLGFRLGPLILYPILYFSAEAIWRVWKNRKYQKADGSYDRYEQIKDVISDDILDCCASYCNDPRAMTAFLDRCVNEKVVSTVSREIILEHYFGKAQPDLRHDCCPYCGTKRLPASRFCSKCGAQLNNP